MNPSPAPAPGTTRGLPDILYLVHRLPYPPDKGDRIRNFHLLEFLRRRANVHLACLADEPTPAESLRALQERCARVAVEPVGRWSRWLRGASSLALGGAATTGLFDSPGLRQTLRDWTRDTRFHACLASSSAMVSYLAEPGLRETPAVIDLVDVDSEKWFDYARNGRPPGAWLHRAEGRRLRMVEQGLPRRFRAVTLVSDAEAELYRGFCQPGEVASVPNGVDLEYYQPRAEAEEPACVFVGALDYRPNVDGICWFASAAWPEIKRRRPEARLVVVGRRPTPEVTRLAALPGVEVVGTVPDVRPFVARSAVAVVPLRLARGLQNKVLEALAMGKAVVASPPALGGVRAAHGTHLLRASSADEWVEVVTRLLDDASLRRRLGESGRAFVEEHHQWKRCLEPFRGLLGL